MTRRVVPIVALDVPATADALRIVDALEERCGYYKIGSELFSAEGPSVVRAVQDRGAAVFLDLKFHDIPNTVRGATHSVAALGVRLLTVHASGGPAMLEAAVAGVGDAGTACRVLGVTVLTSLERAALGAVWGRAVSDMTAEVVRLAGLGEAAGLHGVVCSGQEAPAVRQAYPSKLAILVPGVRLAGDAAQDQARVVTPDAAAAAGADYIVLGRTVTQAKRPAEAMASVLALLR